MSAAEKYDIISISDYLEGEEVSPIKHEFVGGVVYAMAGARVAHNQIASNVLVSLGAQLKGRKCRPFNSDMKVRIRTPHLACFYYPDVSVVCKSNPPFEHFQDDPVVVVEVVSKATRRIDEGEKKDAYLGIPSLSAYLIVEQEEAVVRVHRRSDLGFSREVHAGLSAIVPLPEIGASLPLADVYEGVSFTPETAGEG